MKAAVDTPVREFTRLPAEQAPVHPSGPSVLFAGETMTAAHLLRPLAFASRLNRERYRIRFACDRRCSRHVQEKDLPWHHLGSISSDTFLKRLYRGRPMYTADEVKQYVREEIRLLHALQPDVIVTDMRLSLSISAELVGIPLINIVGAQWSPYSDAPAPLPEHPLTHIAGPTLSSLVFRMSRSWLLNAQVRPFNRVRKALGLKTHAGLRELHTCGDTVLYTDIPELFMLNGLPGSHRFIGPVDCSPGIPLPSGWGALPEDRPTVFISPGSSGSVRAFAKVIEALAGMDLAVIAATAGQMEVAALPPTVYAAEYIPGRAAAQRADLVICNGGSGMVYQALSGGTPVLGIPCNLDQFLIMQAVESKGAGRCLRPERLSGRRVEREIDLLLEEGCRTRARRMKTCIERTDVHGAFERELGRVLDTVSADSGKKYRVKV